MIARFPVLIAAVFLVFVAAWLSNAWSRRLRCRLGTSRPGVAARCARLMLLGGTLVAAVAGLAGYLLEPLVGRGLCGFIGPCLILIPVIEVARLVRAAGLGVSEMGLPGLEDLRLARDLGLRRRGRVIHDARGDGRRSQITRQTVLTPETVIKVQGVDVARIELEKTRRAAKIAADCKFFDVPRVLDADLDSGRIVFERSDDVMPLWDWLVRTRSRDAEEMLVTAGAALATIHEHLQLPADLGEPLSPDWQPPQLSALGEPACGGPVALHGDYNAWNLLVRPRTGRLLVSDWAGSELAGERVTRGPWVFDAAWLIVTLFRQRLGGLERVPCPERYSEVFLESYGQERDLPDAGRLCCDYLHGLLPRLALPRVRGRRREWLRPRLRLEALATFAGSRPGPAIRPGRAA